MKRAARLRAQDARLHAGFAFELGQGLSAGRMLGDVKTFGAILFSLSVIGEAVRHIPREMLGAEPGIPWRSIVMMRNHIVHAYWQIRAETVARVIREDLPGLIAALDRLAAAPDKAP